MDPLILQVGVTIGSAIFKRWSSLGDENVEAGADLAAIASGKIADTLSARRLARKFEEVSELIAERIEEDITRDGGLATKQAVVLAVNECLQGSLSSAIVVELDLDAEKLYSRVRETSGSHIELFSAAEVEFFDRLLKACCYHIISIAGSLPDFNQAVIREMLSRDNALLAKVEMVLRTVEHMDTRNAELTDPEFRSRYIDRAKASATEVQIFGIDVSPSTRRYDLSNAYIELFSTQVSYQLPSTTDINDREGSSLDGTSPPSMEGATTIHDRVRSSQRLIVQGEAGSGKTTLLQWIALNGGVNEDDEEESPVFLIPLRRFFKNDGLSLPRPEQFVEINCPALAGLMPIGWTSRTLKSGGATVLLDGIDEIPASLRETLRTWIVDLIGTYPYNKYIASSRPHAIDNFWKDKLGFEITALLPLGPAEVDELIDHWHQAVAHQITDGIERSELPKLAESLKATLRMSRSLRMLSTSPLLCAMICALHQHRRRQLPSDRLELYEACCQMLIERRETERNIPYHDYPSLNYRQKRALLEHYAYWLVKNGYTESSVIEAEECWDELLTNMNTAPADCSASSTRRLLVERTSILREAVPGQISFAHKTFQEFLAAQAAINARDIGLLADNAHDDQWREVVILAAGLAADKDRSRLLNRLLTRGDQRKRLRHKLHMIAVSCLETSLTVDNAIKSEIESRLEALIPPKDPFEAKNLASAGDLATPHLRSIRSALGTTQRTTIGPVVSSLSTINTEASMAVLDEYAADPKLLPESARAFFDTWESRSFDKDFASRFLSVVMSFSPSIRGRMLPDLSPLRQLPSLKDLDVLVIGRANLQDLEKCLDLESLAVFAEGGYSNISQLFKLSKLRDISLRLIQRSDDIASLDALAKLPLLKSLFLEFAGDHLSLDWINQLNNLESLSLVGLQGKHNLPSLDHLPSLRSLTLDSSRRNWRGSGRLRRPRLRPSHNTLPSFASRIVFGEFSQLRRLEACLEFADDVLGSTTVFSDLSDLRLMSPSLPAEIESTRFPSLTELFIHDPHEDQSFAGISSLTSLEHLAVLGSRDLASLDCSRNSLLKSLTLTSSGRSTDVSFLSDCSSLQQVSLGSAYNDRRYLTSALFRRGYSSAHLIPQYSSGIGGFIDNADLSWLDGLPNLTSLVLCGFNSVESIDYLSNNRELKHLTLIGLDRIEDVKVISSLTKLETVTIQTVNAEAVELSLKSLQTDARVRVIDFKDDFSDLPTSQH